MKSFRHLILALALTGGTASAEEIAVTATPVTVSEPQQIAPLVPMGVVALDSPAAGFGGFSGLALLPDGVRFVAVSDAGLWLTGRLIETDGGQLAGIAGAALAPMRDPAGNMFPDKYFADAEAVAVVDGGAAVLVSFEQRHRVWRYALADLADARPQDIGLAATLGHLPDNGGIEALEMMADGSLVAFSEAGTADGGLIAWRVADGTATPFVYANPAPYVPTDAAALPDGRLLVLNRHYSPLDGVSAVVTMIDPAAIAVGAVVRPTPVARLAPPFPVDNFEGLAVRDRGDGTVDLFIVSDDNYRAVQKTLLAKFRLQIDDLK